MSNVPAMPEDNGTFCEHVITCKCDWLDWSCLCSGISIVIGFVLWIAEISAEPQRTETSEYTAGMLLMLVPIGLWALCVGVPYIAFNTTLGSKKESTHTFLDNKKAIKVGRFQTNQISFYYFRCTF